MSEQFIPVDTLDDCRAAREAAKRLSGSARAYILDQIAEVEAKLTADIMAKRKPVVGSRVLYRAELRPGIPLVDVAAIVTKTHDAYEDGDHICLTIFPAGSPPETTTAPHDQTGKIPGTWRW